MPEYLARIMNEDGSVLRSLQLVCPDDGTAKEYARQLIDGRAIELWQGDRQIERFPKRGA